jgi:hypothetical protein
MSQDGKVIAGVFDLAAYAAELAMTAAGVCESDVLRDVAESAASTLKVASGANGITDFAEISTEDRKTMLSAVWEIERRANNLMVDLLRRTSRRSTWRNNVRRLAAQVHQAWQWALAAGDEERAAELRIVLNAADAVVDQAQAAIYAETVMNALGETK